MIWKQHLLSCTKHLLVEVKSSHMDIGICPVVLFMTASMTFFSSPDDDSSDVEGVPLPPKIQPLLFSKMVPIFFKMVP